MRERRDAKGADVLIPHVPTPVIVSSYTRDAGYPQHLIEDDRIQVTLTFRRSRLTVLLLRSAITAFDIGGETLSDLGKICRTARIFIYPRQIRRATRGGTFLCL